MSPSLSSQTCSSTSPPPIPDSYASLTPAELAAFSTCPSRAPADYDNDDDDEEADNDDEETKDDD
jgi:hypothetical protein